ncbi:MAG: hypothetical protein RR854_00015 [Muribaculaceae bacterium]
MERVRKMTIEEGNRVNISQFPNFSKTGSVIGMKKLYYGKGALLIRCGEYIYNVSDSQEVYYQAKI